MYNNSMALVLIKRPVFILNCQKNMTYIDSQEIKCLKCGHTFSAMIHKTINVSELPDLKDEFLSGKLNQAVCPKCNQTYFITSNVLYHDMRNGIMIHVLLSEEYPNNKEAAIKEFTEEMRECL